jgi:hypothetical protein
MLTEAKIEKRVVAYCRSRGLYTRKFASPAHRGVPDRIICGRGKALFLELKRPGNTPTGLQFHELEELRRHGMIAHWAECFEDAKRIIGKVFSPKDDVIG